MTIRLATDDDLDLVTRMRVAFIADVRGVDVASLDLDFERATRDFVSETHLSGNLHTWIAEEGGECVGVVSLLVYRIPPRPSEERPHDGYVLNMFVTRAHRGHGFGRDLLEACLASAHHHGITRFFLHATEAGRPLYEDAGFAAHDDWLALEVPPGTAVSA